MAKDYRPQAKFQADSGIEWRDLVGQDIDQTDFKWASGYGDRLEIDLLDSSSVVEAIQTLKDLWAAGANSALESHWIRRLSSMALSGNLAITFLSVAKPTVWDDDFEIEIGCARQFFQKLADLKPAIFSGDLAEILEAQGRVLYLRGKGAPDGVFEEALRIRRSVAAVAPATLARKYKLAASLVWNGSYAVAAHKPAKALYFFDESLDILRSLIAEQYSPAFPLFALIQRNFRICLNDPSHVCDLNLALKVAETIVTLSRALVRVYLGCDAMLAAALHDLAFGFPEGRSLQQTNAAQESIDLYRTLANDDPYAYSLPFSDALYNFSCRLLATGQCEQALSVSLEETQNRRKLQDRDCLATCLDQLSCCFSAVGNIAAALNSAEDSVRLRRKLAEDDRSYQSESELACSLSNLSCCLSMVTSRSENTLHAAREAVSIQRGLARDIPAATFSLRFAVFLYNFSVALSVVGRHEEALRAAEEAMQIRTSSGDDGDCALSLSRLASCLRAVCRQDEAVRTVEKCLDITRRLACGHESYPPIRDEAQLAETLFALSFCFGADQASRAVAAVTDSVAIYRKLAYNGLATFQPPLAAALLQLSSLLSSTGQHAEALDVAVEAVQFGRGLSKDFFATSLYNLSLCLSTAGMKDEGVCPAQQCVEIRRELVKENGTWQFKEQLADALFNLSVHFSHLHSSRALASVREAVTVQCQLAEYIPGDKFNRRLADGLQNIAARALLVTEYEEALDSAEEAVNIMRKLVEENPILHNPGFVNILYTYANALCENDRFEEAFRALSESDELRRNIPSDSVFASSEASAAYMSTRARCIIGLGQHGEGLDCLRDAIKIYQEELADRASKVTQFDSFPWFLRNTFACASALGRNNAEVLDVTAVVVDLSRLLAGEHPTIFNRYLEEAQGFHASSLSTPARGSR
ncbi:hypothetical protein B0H17DRAFT_1202288 [Mycena rosella]|uniref:TPR-like protein n=1 Tax=Mycena rosella TaxID=1033263 RepID=A0AAD7DEL8_MYCRO|nr:hypothetical protein B0H17DRAFT_1202288 [Mycena rosella]